MKYNKETGRVSMNLDNKDITLGYIKRNETDSMFIIHRNPKYHIMRNMNALGFNSDLIFNVIVKLNKLIVRFPDNTEYRLDKNKLLSIVDKLNTVYWNKSEKQIMIPLELFNIYDSNGNSFQGMSIDRFIKECGKLWKIRIKNSDQLSCLS